MDPMTSVLKNVVGLYHPWTSVQNRSGELGTRERSRIVSSLNFSSERIRWLLSSRMWWDRMILELWFRTNPVTSVLENVVGLYHPWTSVQNVYGDFGPRECGGIVSSLNFSSERIRWLRSSRMWWDCIVPELQFITDPVTSILANVVGLYHPKTLVQNESGDFGPRECGGIVSSLNFGSERIRWLRYSRMW